ncbi:FtsJ-like methyltransferase-domain-containing protein [Hypoxylon fragiforme]|uniref:FtsJ-like methyltransferase-domain-containing protein n=1 Tax=Hypoxylon fragiforme TaxID=63214 RepID=UPI0020C5D305|nr:FtsJ-like methyltransferase-domain-containing protein [Hypoxylon fragiforme]KAI2606495.1 FtsJ-like methyltransferase-domain-containing protein [Hypoxylon fragiforme]
MSMWALARIKAPLNGGLIRTTALTAALPSPSLRGTLSFVVSESIRYSSSSSSTRWKDANSKDKFAQQAKIQGFKSRAAFKLLEMDSKYKLFKRGQTVVDLGYAPGSWSQVVVDRTKPNGRVVGIDIIPAQPPKGVSTIQGNFLSPGVQKLVKDYLIEFAQRKSPSDSAAETTEGITERPSYIDSERSESTDHHSPPEGDGRLVDVVISDMCEPWYQNMGPSRTLSNPSVRRLMNTSGMSFRDHAGSMDLCLAALQFASDTLKTNGHFVCKFYQGSEDKDLELMLKKLFAKVHREKPNSSKSDSREAYFVALRRKGGVTLSDIAK